MKFVMTTRLFATDQWLIEILFLLLLPFLMLWRGIAMIKRSSKVQEQ